MRLISLLRRAALFVPFLIYSKLALCGVLATSETPVFFNKYSFYLALLNTWNAFFLTAVVWAIKKRKFGLICSLNIILIINTYLLSGNNTIGMSQNFYLLVSAVRLAACVEVLYICMKKGGVSDFFKNQLVFFSFFFIALTVIDSSLFYMVARGHFKGGTQSAGFRERYDLNNITNKDIVLIGDSFVWGSGVNKSEAFGERLRHRMHVSGKSGTVYSLGIAGAGLSSYVQILHSVPSSIKANRVIVCYYMNDMPQLARIETRLLDQLVSLKRSTLLFGWGGDLIAKRMIPTAEKYTELVIKSYDKGDSSFSERWGIVRDKLKEIKHLADSRSLEKPIFMIIPLFVNYNQYPLRQNHRDLTTVAKDLGFEVLDLLPILETLLVDGSDYRLENDNHCNADVHDLISKILSKKLMLE